jgi:hypothetical protein
LIALLFVVWYSLSYLLPLITSCADEVEHHDNIVMLSVIPDLIAINCENRLPIEHVALVSTSTGRNELLHLLQRGLKHTSHLLIAGNCTDPQGRSIHLMAGVVSAIADRHDSQVTHLMVKPAQLPQFFKHANISVFTNAFPKQTTQEIPGSHLQATHTHKHLTSQEGVAMGGFFDTCWYADYLFHIDDYYFFTLNVV